MISDPVPLLRAANEARGLAIDAVHACSSGHLGLPLGAAEIGATLFGELLSFNPREPRWINRDRFILSAGHGSMFLYAWLHLAGYDLSLDELRRFRQWHSRTPGHPEFGETAGVECTTGPLGQGVGNAVGMAMSAKMAAARYNKEGQSLLDYRIVCLAGDGCMQEGVAAEAVAFAGHFGLGNLILIYDSNDVTLDAMASATQSEDTAGRFKATGWDVQTVDGHDLAAFAAAYLQARHSTNGRPQLIIARTVIGKGIPEVAGTAKAHGEGGAKFAETARQGLGLPKEEHFYVSAETRTYFAKRTHERVQTWHAWQQRYADWAAAHPELAVELAAAAQGTRPTAEALLDKIPAFAIEAKLATRKAGSDVLQPLAAALPVLMSGSADLHGSTLNYIAGGGDFTRGTPAGRNVRFGIREHAMGAILNGLAYDGLFIPSGATFLTFSDYCRPSIRIAALAKLPVVYIFTHDSIGVGEDGPTHQPVEIVSALRLIPNLTVIRPADPEETAAAFAAAFARTDGPTALVLTRQTVPNLSQIPVEDRRLGTLRGGYVAKRETGPLKTILLATGSELSVAIAAAGQIGPGVRVVSLPSWELFNAQSAEYRESVLPAAIRHRLSLEAGVTGMWGRWTGLDGVNLGLDHFGASAPGDRLMKEFGITVEAVVAAACK